MASDPHWWESVGSRDTSLLGRCPLCPVGKSQLPSNSPSDHWYFSKWSDHNHHRQKQQIENQDWQPDGEFVMSVMSSSIIFKSSTIYNSGDQRKLCKTAKAIWYVVDFWPFQRDKNKSCCFHMKSHKTDTSLTFASLKLYSDAWSLFPHGTVFASSFVPKMPKPSSLIWKLQKWSLRNVEFLFCTFWRSHPRLPKIYLKITNDLWIAKTIDEKCWISFLHLLKEPTKAAGSSSSSSCFLNKKRKSMEALSTLLYHHHHHHHSLEAQNLNSEVTFSFGEL